MMGGLSSQESSENAFHQDRSVGVTSPQTPTVNSVYATSNMRRKAGRPRTRPLELKPSIVGQVPSSCPDLDDQSLGSQMRKSLLHFMQTGKYDEIKYLLKDNCVTGTQVTDRLYQKLNQAIARLQMSDEQFAKQSQATILERPE